MKLLKIIFINILAIIIIIVSTELFLFVMRDIQVYKRTNAKLVYYNKNPQKYTLNMFLKSFLYTYYYSLKYNKYNLEKSNFRNVEFVENSTKPAIVLMGCSYVYGEGLSDNDTFSHLLAAKTNRTVYNLGVNGGSPKEALYILRDEKFLNEYFETDKNIQYFIYTFIPHHKSRIYASDIPNSPYYKKIKSSDGIHLELYQQNPLKQSFLCKNTIQVYFSMFNANKAFDLYCLYMQEIKKEIENKYRYKDEYGNEKIPETVILVYEDWYNDDWKRLEKQGFKIIKVSNFFPELFDKKYRLPDFHPNVDAWQVIVPTLVKELNL